MKKKSNKAYSHQQMTPGENNLFPYLSPLLFVLFLVLFEVVFERIYTSLHGKSFVETAGCVIYYGEKNPFLGTVIVFAMILEFIAFILFFMKSQDKIKNIGPGLIYIWIAHFVITILLFITALSAFGIHIEDDSNSIFPVFFFLLIGIKEVALLFLTLQILIIPEKFQLPPFISYFADAFLAFYYIVAYTVICESTLLAPGTNLHQHFDNIPILILQSFAALIVFLIFFFPLHLRQYIEKKSFSVPSIIFLSILALFPLFKEYNPPKSAFARYERAPMISKKAKKIYYQGNWAYQRKDWLTAEQKFNEVLRKFPDDFNVSVWLAAVYLKSNQLQHCENVETKVLLKAPYYIHYNFEPEYLFTNLGPNVSKKSTLHVHIGIFFYLIQEYKNALDHFLEAYNSAPNADLIHFYISDSYRNLRKNNEAIQWAKKGRSVNPHAYYFYRILGKLYSKDQDKDLSKSEENYKKAIALKPDLGILYYELGSFYHSQHNFIKAKHHFEMAIEKIDPDKDDEKHKKIKKILKEAVKLSKNNAT